jgi:two-component system, NarL family, response regulator NreC
VLVVSTQAVMRSTLRRVLEAEDDIEVVAEATDLRSAALEDGLDVVLIDEPVRLGEAKVVMVAAKEDPRSVLEAFAAGVNGYVLEEAADTEVADAVREVANGGRYVHPELGARVVALEAEERARADDDPLSGREWEVLLLLALGHTNQEIAKMLYLSVRTVETHRAHIMQKLRLETRAELVRYAIDHGLLDERE